jgi:hypothetical protein
MEHPGSVYHQNALSVLLHPEVKAKSFRGANRTPLKVKALAHWLWRWWEETLL